MRIAVISDVHANSLALDAVLKDVDRHDVDGLWSLGDMIGRGYDPLRCARTLMRRYHAQSAIHQQAWLCGNHEKSLLDEKGVGFVKDPDAESSISAMGGNVYMIQMILEHRTRLFGDDHTKNADIEKWLRSLPPYRDPLFGHVYLAHGVYELNDVGAVDADKTFSVYPFDDANVSDMMQRLISLRGVTHGLIMGGHTHVSRLLVWDDVTQRARNVDKHLLTQHHFDLTQQLVYVNVGSVGFPRRYPPYDDLCPTYVLLETEDDTFDKVHITYRRVAYQVPVEIIPNQYPKPYRDELLRCCQHSLD